MKYLKYLGICLIFILSITLGLSQSSEIIIESSNPHISEELLNKAAEIVMERLQTAQVEVVSTKTIGDQGKIHIEYKGDISENWKKNLLTNQGQLKFRETVDRKLFLDAIDRSDPIFNLLDLKDDGETMPEQNAILAKVNIELINSLSEHLLRLQNEGKLLEIDIAWGLQHENQDEISIYVLKKLSPSVEALSGRFLKHCQLDTSQDFVAIMLEFNETGTKKWAEITRKNIDKMVAVTLDEQVLIAPRVRIEISSGKCQITGDFDEKEGRYLLAIMDSDELPATFKILN